MNISDEAVEAAYSTLRTATVTGPIKVTRREMRQAVEAATPHIVREAQAESWEEGALSVLSSTGTRLINPYRSQS